MYSKFSEKTPIKEVKEGFDGWIAGRIIDIKNSSFTIADESGMLVLTPVPEGFQNLDIAAFKLKSEQGEFKIIETRLLTRSVNKIDITSQWQKAVINRDLMKIIIGRENIIRNIREYFLNENFIEINTPYLVYAPSTEDTLTPFEITESPTGRNLYLTMSPEYNLKRFLTIGFEKIFQIAHSFRNEKYDKLHNPEFLNLEWYRAYADYTNIMRDLSILLPEIAISIHGSTVIRYGDMKIDFSQMEKISVEELFFDEFHEELSSFEDINDLKDLLKSRNIVTNNINRWNDLFYAWIVNKEPFLGLKKPCILYDYPHSCAALSRLKDSNKFYAERFELYIGGIEIANAYSELNDPDEQLKRIKQELKSHPKIPFNRDFQKALEIGMPPSGGIAFGLDRFIMILLGKNSIHEIMSLSFKDLKREISISRQ